GHAGVYRRHEPARATRCRRPRPGASWLLRAVRTARTHYPTDADRRRCLHRRDRGGPGESQLRGPDLDGCLLRPHADRPLAAVSGDDAAAEADRMGPRPGPRTVGPEMRADPAGVRSGRHAGVGALVFPARVQGENSRRELTYPRPWFHTMTGGGHPFRSPADETKQTNLPPSVSPFWYRSRRSVYDRPATRPGRPGAPRPERQGQR